MKRYGIRGLALFEEFLTSREHDSLVEAADRKLRRRPYERDHWDAVIVNYRETELLNLEGPAADAVRKAAAKLNSLGFAEPLLPPHVVDLAPDGRIFSHIDSVKFSGGVVAGISLLSSATMRLEEADPAEGRPVEGGASLDLALHPRSFYVLAGPARYVYTHSIFDVSSRRLSLILRDQMRNMPSSSSSGHCGLSSEMS